MNRHATPQNLRAALTATIASAFLAACSAAPQAEEPVIPPLQGADIGGDFELVGSDGETVRWTDFEGQYRIVYFGFTFCPDICPTDTQRMAQGLEIFAEKRPQQAAKIQPMFISIDPARDTPEKVGEYAAAFSDRLIGLTGSEEQVKAAADTFRVFYSRGEDTPGGGYLMDHSNIVYLFGPDGEPLATLPTDEGAESVAAELNKWVS
ncbi:SCO family protein [Altererythrobacter lutimaris]|uniref:SCO family protein n=1 Tax=Altererythrobacter lutimaris TaxID=2743979 RepID=A0A850HD42_9SPHN|nr:SCO family protein [Altererythrobacter lutimaris]NVE94906.1 SCO family protein [Altererythrobacter lutimaris]